jgi:hypothetical protein
VYGIIYKATGPTGLVYIATLPEKNERNPKSSRNPASSPKDREAFIIRNQTQDKRIPKKKKINFSPSGNEREAPHPGNQKKLSEALKGRPKPRRRQSLGAEIRRLARGVRNMGQGWQDHIRGAGSPGGLGEQAGETPQAPDIRGKGRSMTAKQAIKARCRDCLAGSRECTFTDCALKALVKSKGKVKASAIKAYCRWCLNGHLFKACASPECAIYQYRKERENTPELPKKQGVQRGFFHTQDKKGSWIPPATEGA